MSKQLKGDRALLRDESASPGQRVSALDRLLADGDLSAAEDVKVWLSGRDQYLKQSALQALLRSMDRDCIGLALEWLKPGAFPASEGDDEYIDQDASAKMAAASGLSMYLYAAWLERQRVCQMLASTLMTSSDPGVQRACYTAILAAEGVLFAEVPAEFVRDKHVDRRVVDPFLPSKKQD
jgi:hypothetical protein